MQPMIFVLGDSISIQYHPYLQKALAGWVEVQRKTGMEAALANLDVAQGANGGDSSNCLAYLRGMAADGAWRPGLVLLNCGLHDVKCQPGLHERQVSAEAYAANLRQMAELLGARGTPLAWIRTTQVDEAKHNTATSGIWRYRADVDAYNAAADAVMRELGVPVLDLAGFTASLGDELTEDGRHFPEAVRAQQAAYIAGWVEAYLAQRA